MSKKIFVGINLMVDPSVALVADGKVLAYSEEERHNRIKHSANIYPSKALRSCMDSAGCSFEDIKAIAINWNLDAFSNGLMRAFYESIRDEYDVDPVTVRWQERNLDYWNRPVYEAMHRSEWRRIFGDIEMPPIIGRPHHFVHCFQAYRQSPFDSAITVTVDGSGDQHCTVVWKCEGETVKPYREFRMPHSLGWVYAAFTEYLGFQAYDGEYKLMGLAAFGDPDDDLRNRIREVVRSTEDGGYRVNPYYLHYGAHSFSGRFTDKLAELIGFPPRRSSEDIGDNHKSLAFEVQLALETIVANLVDWAVDTTGIRNLCISGGVGLNVKMNSRLFESPKVDDVFAHPLCGDCGSAAGAALAVCYEQTGAPPEKLETLALGHQEDNGEIERVLKQAKICYERPEDICAVVASELAQGKIVGWFQGRMEAGPRALGQRSILADPRHVENRDKVNAIIKFREFWRPFCPSILAEHMGDYFDHYTAAPFMIIAFKANDRLKRDAPAIVHIDGTSRVQMVEKETNPRYHELLSQFHSLTGVPVILNTSFNVKGEPIVCTTLDALRTFWSTGLDILAAGNFIVRKPS